MQIEAKLPQSKSLSEGQCLANGTLSSISTEEASTSRGYMSLLANFVPSTTEIVFLQQSGEGPALFTCQSSRLGNISIGPLQG